MSQEQVNHEEDEDALPELDEGFIEAADIDEEEEVDVGDAPMEGDDGDDDAEERDEDEMEVDGDQENVAREDNSLGHTCEFLVRNIQKLTSSSAWLFVFRFHRLTSPFFPEPSFGNLWR